MTKTYEIPNGKMIMADVDEKHHMATVSVFALDDLIEAANKTGHWIDEFGGCECSECGCLEGGYSDYCPNCGARMIDPQESDHKCHTCKTLHKWRE